MNKEILFDRIEAAEYLGVSVKTLQTWATRNLHGLHYRKLGRRVQYLKQDLDDLISRKTFGRLEK